MSLTRNIGMLLIEFFIQNIPWNRLGMIRVGCLNELLLYPASLLTPYSSEGRYTASMDASGILKIIMQVLSAQKAVGHLMMFDREKLIDVVHQGFSGDFAHRLFPNASPVVAALGDMKISLHSHHREF